MTAPHADEIRATHDRYLTTRRRIEAGELGWDASGGGKFSFEMDLLNMVHVNELLRECGWRPPAGFHMPPKHPRR